MEKITLSEAQFNLLLDVYHNLRDEVFVFLPPNVLDAYYTRLYADTRVYRKVKH